MSEAIGEQSDHGRRLRHEADLTDILISSIVLAEALRSPAPRKIAMEGIDAFQTLGLSEQDCTAILTYAEYKVGSLNDALGV